MILDELQAKIKGTGYKLVFTEGDDIRVLTAAVKGGKQKLFIPIVLGDETTIKELAIANKLDIKQVTIVDPKTSPDFKTCLDKMVELRAGKQSAEECEKLLAQRNYFGTMMVKLRIADALVGGATYSTADTIRPALQLVKARPGLKSVSSSFILIPKTATKPILIQGDCAVIINPTAAELADIAIATVDTARFLGVDPRVALLSFSTLGSAKSPETIKVSEAASILKEKNVDFPYVGEIQFDAAISSNVGSKKAPNNPVAGTCNVFIYPTLDAGNIGYKISQYLGNYKAVGPLLQGLNAPINDLSRGANAAEIFDMAVLTIAQAISFYSESK
jgi:phosphate acetyltransferase